jgi:hypothetical protein
VVTDGKRSFLSLSSRWLLVTRLNGLGLGEINLLENKELTTGDTDAKGEGYEVKLRTWCLMGDLAW